MTDAKNLPFDQVVTALRNWSQGIPDIRARDPEALASRVLDHITTLTRERDAERAVIEAAKALCDVINPPKMESYTDYKAAAGVCIAAVTALRALEGEA